MNSMHKRLYFFGFRTRKISIKYLLENYIVTNLSQAALNDIQDVCVRKKNNDNNNTQKIIRKVTSETTYNWCESFFISTCG